MQGKREKPVPEATGMSKCQRANAWMLTGLVTVVTGLLFTGCLASRPGPTGSWYPDQGGARFVTFLPNDAGTSQRRLQITLWSPGEMQPDEVFPLALEIKALTGPLPRGEEIRIQCRQLSVEELTPNRDLAVTVDGSVSWQIGGLPAKATRRAVIRLEAAAAGQAGVSLILPCGDSIEVPLEIKAPKLDLKLSSPSPLPLDYLVPIRASITNTGSGTARSPRLEVDVPDGLSPDAAGPGGGQAAGGLVKALRDIPPSCGQSVEFVFHSQHTGLFPVQAALYASPDIALTAETDVLVVAPEISMQVFAPDRPCVNVPCEWRVEISNTGDFPARGTLLTCRLPAGVHYVSSSGADLVSRQVTWNLGTIVPDQTVTATLTVRVVKPLTWRNVLTVSATSARVVTTETDITYTRRPLLDLAINRIEALPATWEVEVTNSGSLEAINVRLLCETESGSAPDSTEGVTPADKTGAITRFQPLPKLPAKSKARWILHFPGTSAPALTATLYAEHLRDPLTLSGN